MRNRRAGVSLSLVLLLALLVVAVIPAGAAILRVNVSADNIVLPQGQTAVISIMITDAPNNNISAARINLTYKSNVVEVVSVGNSDFDNDYGFFFYNTTPTNGTVRMIGIQYGNSSDPDPPDNLATPVLFAEVTVKAIGNKGDYTPLNLEIADINMGSGSEYHEVLLNNGSITIPSGVPALNVYGMIALIGLLAMVLAIGARRRR
jgi:uncharacterized protein (UPF0333 family)